MTPLEKEMRRISRLPHQKNEFLSDRFFFSKYPVVHKAIQEQAAQLKFVLAPSNKDGQCLPCHAFELQTHQRSVEEHKDDVHKGEHFGVFPVGSKIQVSDGYSSFTVLNYRRGRKKYSSRLYTAELVIFDPATTHSLIYYGEETTFMLFTLYKM